MKLRTALLSATVLALPIAAQAQPVTGLYVGAGAGVNFKQDQTMSGFLGCGVGLSSVQPGPGCGGNAKVGYDTGFVVLGSVGWGFGNGLRVEMEGSYRNNGLNRISAYGYSIGARGDNGTTGLMFNVLYDVNLGLNWLYPYIGGGVGYAWSKFNSAGVRYSGYPYSVSATSNDTVGGFAYQAIAGASFPISSAPGLSMTAEYRFFGADGGNVVGSSCVSNGFRDCSTGKFKVGNQQNHAIMLGLRYAFSTGR